MSNNQKFLNDPKHALDLPFQKSVKKKVNALLNARIVDLSGNIIGTVSYSDSDTIFQFKSSGAGQAYIAGEWDPAATYPDTSKGQQAIVFYTPAGGATGTYYSLQAVAAGISPGTGAPNWAAFPNSPPGVWA